MITLTLLHPLKPIPVQVWNFEHESVIRIGRSTDNQVILYSAVVSRHHVELRRVGANWEIVNLGTNGTYLDGKRITQVPVVDGAIIRLARSGPNIQIRMGNGAAQDLPSMLAGDRTINQRDDAPQLETEITGQHPQPDELAKPAKPEAQPPPKGTIPVPAHLQLTASSDAAAIDGRGAVTIAAQPDPDPVTAIPTACEHRGGGTLFCSDCGQPLHVLHTLGAYQLIKVLGQGNVGVTYLAWRDGQTVVLKTLSDKWLHDSEARAALECEAEVLRQLHHPRLPHLLEESTTEHPYLVMEFMPGQSLAQRVATAGAVSVQRAIDWMLQVCDLLTYLHAFTPPILHRSIQPAHLICRTRLGTDKIALVGFGAIKTLVLNRTSNFVSANFSGLLRQAAPTKLLLQRAVHSAYTAPEHLRIDATPAVDLYSLAPTLAYLLTGQDPVSFYRRDEQGDRFDAKSIPGLSPALIAVLQKLTHPQSKECYPTAAALAAALRQII